MVAVVADVDGTYTYICIVWKRQRLLVGGWVLNTNANVYRLPGELTMFKRKAFAGELEYRVWCGNGWNSLELFDGKHIFGDLHMFHEYTTIAAMQRTRMWAETTQNDLASTISAYGFSQEHHSTRVDHIPPLHLILSLSSTYRQKSIKLFN